MNATEQPDPAEPKPQAPHENASAAVRDFVSKMQEYYGVAAIAVVWSIPNEETSGWVTRGNASSVYGMMRHWEIQQDELWRKEIREA